MNRNPYSPPRASRGPADKLATWLRRARAAADAPGVAESLVLPLRRAEAGLPAAPLREIRLDIDNDRHARAAVQAYADSCEAEMPWLATVLRERLQARRDSPECAQTVWRLFHVAWQRAQQAPNYSKREWNHVHEMLISVLESRRPR